MKRKAILSLISFLYTQLYVLTLDNGIFISPFLFFFSKSRSVASGSFTEMAILLTVILNAGVVMLVAYQFNKLRGSFIWIYLSSLLGSFLMPLFFDSLNSASVISFQWYFTGVIILLQNLLLGPAMTFLLCYLIVRAFRR